MITVNCKKCDKPLRVQQDVLGKRIKCPGCNHVGVAEAPPPPPDEPAASGDPFGSLSPSTEELEPRVAKDKKTNAPKASSRAGRASTPARQSGRRYRLVCKLDPGRVAQQTIIWVLLSLVTCGFALPFFAYFFWKLIINETEIIETGAGDDDEDYDND